MCDNLEEALDRLTGEEAAISTPTSDEGWGLLAQVTLPSGSALRSTTPSSSCARAGTPTMTPPGRSRREDQGGHHRLGS
jgi:hypothetical protein